MADRPGRRSALIKYSRPARSSPSDQPFESRSIRARVHASFMTAGLQHSCRNLWIVASRLRLSPAIMARRFRSGTPGSLPASATNRAEPASSTRRQSRSGLAMADSSAIIAPSDQPISVTQGADAGIAASSPRAQGETPRSWPCPAPRDARLGKARISPPSFSASGRTDSGPKAHPGMMNRSSCRLIVTVEAPHQCVSQPVALDSIRTYST